MAKRKLTPQQEQEQKQALENFAKDTFLEAFWELDDSEKEDLLCSDRGRELFPNGLQMK